MKRMISVGLLLIFTLIVNSGIYSYMNYVPEFDKLSTFDPSRYYVTRQLQEFKIRPNGREWVLSSFRYYDGKGVLQREELYQIDNNGMAYYIAPNGNRIESWKVVDTNDLTDFLESWNVSEEIFDSQGRVTDRTAYSPHTDGTYDSIEVLHWHYCPGSTAGDKNTVCSYIRTMQLKVHPGEETFVFEGEEQIPVYETTGYEIMNYDKYGNELQVWVEDKSYIITDIFGFIQMIYEEHPLGGTLIRVDEYGRPLWLANYNLVDNTLSGYSIWTYEDIN